MGRVIRSMDWSQTPLGRIQSWPQSLRTAISICLASDLPICIIWGPELVQLYNDGYRVICGDKHPSSMGQNFKECWREAWPVIGEAHDSALAGETAFLENQHIFLERHGYTEECFFTFSFSPIRDEAARLAGIFHPVIEMTPKLLGERRTRTLRDLVSRTGNAKSIKEAFAPTGPEWLAYAEPRARAWIAYVECKLAAAPEGTKPEIEPFNLANVSDEMLAAAPLLRSALARRSFAVTLSERAGLLRCVRRGQLHLTPEQERRDVREANL